MTTLILALMMQTAATQFLVSTKAGLVNYVQGASTVKVATSVRAGQIVGTGPAGAVELLLNPGSYLRMGENSKIVLERVELYDIAVRMLEGSTVIEANGFDKELPLTVTVGNLTLEIIENGVYLFSDGKTVIIDGKIRNPATKRTYGKNYQLSAEPFFVAQKVKRFPTGLELWSQRRGAEISRANLNVARSLRQVNGLPVSSFLDVWLWHPAFGSFIYMPGRRYRSPYGYRYQTAGEIYTGGGGGSFAGGASSGGGGFPNPPTGGGNNSGGGNTASGGGGSFGGGSFSGSSSGAGASASSSTVISAPPPMERPPSSTSSHPTAAGK
jgi:hypothetical protein